MFCGNGVCVLWGGVVILRNDLSSSSLFFVAFPLSVTQVSSNTEGEKMSITKATGSGSSVEIICDLITQTLKYIHWYKYQEGTAPRRLLYYDISYSKVVLESGVSEGKYKVYKEKSYTFAILNLQESDSGMYYCAAWEKHVGLDFLYTALEILLVTAKHSRGIQYRSALASLTAPNSLYSEGREILSSVPIPQHLYSITTHPSSQKPHFF